MKLKLLLQRYQRAIQKANHNGIIEVLNFLQVVVTKISKSNLEPACGRQEQITTTNLRHQWISELLLQRYQRAIQKANHNISNEDSNFFAVVVTKISKSNLESKSQHPLMPTTTQCRCCYKDIKEQFRKQITTPQFFNAEKYKLLLQRYQRAIQKANHN